MYSTKDGKLGNEKYIPIMETWRINQIYSNYGNVEVKNHL